MEGEKPSAIDEKTAKIIEEMDKSLHTMEQSLGMDHMVVAKILDSYAKLLKQNNLRPLDALNMEARAKAIRAKLNQKEAEEQSKGLDTESAAVNLKPIVSIDQLRIFSWVSAMLILCGLAYGALDMVAKSKLHADKVRLANAAARAKELKEHAEQGEAANTITGVREGMPSNLLTNGNAPVTVPDGAVAETTETQDPKSGATTTTTIVKNLPGATAAVPSSAPATTAVPQEVLDQIEQVKSLATDQLAVGLDAEKNQDNAKAAEAYSQVVRAVQNAQSKLGRSIASEDIAQCFEGYARMADQASQQEVARQWTQAAADCRAQIAKQ